MAGDERSGERSGGHGEERIGFRPIAQAVLFLFVLACCFFVPAQRLLWLRMWLWLAVMVGFIAMGFALLPAELVRARSRTGVDVARWDLALATLAGLFLYPGTLIVAGLDVAHSEGRPAVGRAGSFTALAIFAAGYGFAFWAMKVNPFFETFVRIQNDRNQYVISSGPYASVRHPGYAGAIAAHLALPFVLGSFAAVAPAVAGSVLFAIRCVREEKELSAGLAGYDEYCQRVRWRLLPGIW